MISIIDLTRLIEYNSCVHFLCLPQHHGYFRFPFPCRALGYSSIEFPEINLSIMSFSITATILAVELRCDLQHRSLNDKATLCALPEEWVWLALEGCPSEPPLDLRKIILPPWNHFVVYGVFPFIHSTLLRKCTTEHDDMIFNCL